MKWALAFFFMGLIAGFAALLVVNGHWIVGSLFAACLLLGVKVKG